MKQVSALGALTRLYRVSYTIHAGHGPYMQVLGVDGSGSHDERRLASSREGEYERTRHRAGFLNILRGDSLPVARAEPGAKFYV